jgi:PTH2 family peptidyl-tRNA hydrolase
MVVRKDLGMGTGKIAAQVAHAAVMAAERTKERKPDWFHEWFHYGQAKVVVKVQSLEVLVQDSGLTQIPPGTPTCIGIGPAPSETVDKVTERLKLL